MVVPGTEEGTHTVTRVVRKLLPLTVLAALAAPAAAHADPVSDCAKDGKLDHQYSNEQLKKALDNIPSDLAEYSDCQQVISSAIHSDSGKGQGHAKAHDSGAGKPVSPQEQKARDKDSKELAGITGDSGGDPPTPDLQVGGKDVKPGSNGLFDLASSSNDLPVPLLVALIAIALLAVAGGVMALRSRVPALARLPLLSKIPTPRVPFGRFRR
jgi:hypothetical protein